LATTIQIKKEEVEGAKNSQEALAKLDEKYGGKWVAILENGEVIAREDLDELFDLAKEKSLKISTVFRAQSKDELLFR